MTGLGFRLLSDEDQGGGKRWVLVAPPEGGTPLLLARPAGPGQEAALGRQAGGRVAFFLRTGDFVAAQARLLAAGAPSVRRPGAKATAPSRCGGIPGATAGTCSDRPESGSRP